MVETMVDDILWNKQDTTRALIGSKPFTITMETYKIASCFYFIKTIENSDFFSE